MRLSSFLFGVVYRTRLPDYRSVFLHPTEIDALDLIV